MKRNNYIILFVCLAAVLFALYCYNPSQLYFLNDDFVHIPLSSDFVFLQHNTFRPVCDLSILLDFLAWNKNASGYHLTNLLLHIAVTILIYKTVILYALRYRLQHEQQIALCTAVLFFVYAHHSEAVFWIIGRSAMLGMIFFLPAVIFYAGRGKYAFTAAIIFSWLAWCSYESTWIILFITAGIAYADCRMGLSTTRKEVTRIVIIGANFLSYLLIRYLFIHEVAGNYEAANLWQGNFFVLSMNYAKLLVRCWLPYTAGSYTLATAAALLLVAVVCLLVFKKHQHRKRWLLLTTALLVSLLPYISLGIDTHGTESERFLYLPSFFAGVLLVMLIFSLQSNLYRSIFFFTLLVFHLSILYNNALHYRHAGDITKTFAASLQKIPVASKLYVDSVPTQCKGALVFRQGLAECIDWMGQEDSLIHYSQRQNDCMPFPSYGIRMLKTNIDKPGTDVFITQPGLVYMRFTDTALLVFQNPSQ